MQYIVLAKPRKNPISLTGGLIMTSLVLSYMVPTCLSTPALITLEGCLPPALMQDSCLFKIHF